LLRPLPAGSIDVQTITPERGAPAIQLAGEQWKRVTDAANSETPGSKPISNGGFQSQTDHPLFPFMSTP
jgi:hypothetical protein